MCLIKGRLAVLKPCIPSDFAFAVNNCAKQGATVVLPNRPPIEFTFTCVGDGEHTFVASALKTKERLMVPRDGRFKYIMNESTVSHEWTGQRDTPKAMSAFNKTESAAQRAKMENATAMTEHPADKWADSYILDHIQKTLIPPNGYKASL